MKRPNFSGRWKYCAESSTLQIVNPDSALFVIEHNEPSFNLERTLEFDGQSDTFGLELTVGEENVTASRGCATLYPTLKWEDDQLVFLTRVIQGENEATNLVRYSLEDHGATLVAEESFRSPEQSYDNRWVFKRDS